jgi:hypothetical protein
MKCDIMDEIVAPSSKRWLLHSENLPISELPNMPAGKKSYLLEKRMAKAVSSSPCNLLNVHTTTPFNLQVVPDTLTELTIKEQVLSVLVNPAITHDTRIILRNSPIPPFQQILSV